MPLAAVVPSSADSASPRSSGSLVAHDDLLGDEGDATPTTPGGTALSDAADEPSAAALQLARAATRPDFWGPEFYAGLVQRLYPSQVSTSRR